MTLYELDCYFKKLLLIDSFNNDYSLNGIQVQNSKPSETQIKKIGFSVDASIETIEIAIKENVQMLFVHHGLFWKKPLTITGIHYDRISKLLLNDIVLYGVHLPLDAHEFLGNNAQFAKSLEFEDTKPFGEYEGKLIGVKGNYSKKIKFSSLVERIKSLGDTPLHIFSFGKEEIKTVGIISGSGGNELSQAIRENLDVYITGDIKYENYNEAKDSKINLIVCGHYFSETFGVKAIMNKINEEMDIQTVFISAPTGI